MTRTSVGCFINRAFNLMKRSTQGDGVTRFVRRESTCAKRVKGAGPGKEGNGNHLLVYIYNPVFLTICNLNPFSRPITKYLAEVPCQVRRCSCVALVELGNHIVDGLYKALSIKKRSRDNIVDLFFFLKKYTKVGRRCFAVLPLYFHVKQTAFLKPKAERTVEVR